MIGLRSDRDRVLLSAAGAFSCTFENDECGWTEDQTDDFDWTRASGQTASFGTGPSFDHTTGSK